MRRNAGLAAAFRPDYGSRAVAGDLKPSSEIDEALARRTGVLKVFEKGVQLDENGGDLWAHVKALSR